ncbi:MAG: UDP-3-O-(3-hydroxymyristoyl)glucosamine N-acyltransferase [Pseudomonadota bacterium]
MHKQISDIINEFKEYNLFLRQEGPDNLITGISDVKHCGEGNLVFIDNEKFIEFAHQQKPSAIVTNDNLASSFSDIENTSLLISPNVKLAQALLMQTYVDRNIRENGWPRIHTSASIHESVSVADSVTIGPGAVISKNVSLGDGCVIMANAVIEEDVSIGADSVIYPNVTISYQCNIGERCIIKSGAVIGMEGFGFAQDQQQKSYRVPQLGNVVIGNDVVIGANCTIDRAAFLDTKIGNGCKFDTLIHIAHNVQIDEDGLIAAQSVVAGSTVIGKRVRFSGQTGILDHLKISDDTYLVQRAGVSADINQPGIYAGHPAQPMRKWFKNIAVFKQLDELKKSIKSLQKTIKD